MCSKSIEKRIAEIFSRISPKFKYREVDNDENVNFIDLFISPYYEIYKVCS